MIEDISNTTNSKMEKSLGVLKDELSGIRAGRANPKLLDKIKVDYYGAPTPLNQVANLSVPEPRLLVIAPWDPNMISEIEKEVQKSDIGITPTNDGKIIRLVFPELTEERRKDLVKIIHKMGEDAKVAIRMVRRDANDSLKKLKKSSEITEDDFNDAEKEVQSLTDEYVKEVDQLIKDKEKEILEL